LDLRITICFYNQNEQNTKKLKKVYLTKLLATSCFKLQFGNFGIKVLEATKLTAKQIESIRQTVNRQLNRKGKVWVRVFPHIPVTSKPTENRMGKGKGSTDYWCAPIKAGTILFEVGGNVPSVKIIEALKKGCSKLQVRTRIISKYDVK
jgi:large subunit ribosomal protein L16